MGRIPQSWYLAASERARKGMGVGVEGGGGV